MPSDNSSRLLYTLKSRGPLATSALARVLGITVVGIRQHLAKLHAEGLVAFDDQAGEIGRPKRFWRLTTKAHGRFPDSHGDLTVNLIGGIRSVFGEEGLDRLIAVRQKSAVEAYRRALEPCSGLEDRSRTVAARRPEEGYMAEFEAGRQFSPHRKSLPYLRSGKDMPGLLPVRARIVSGRIRHRSNSHAAGASSLQRASLCLSGDKSRRH